jgi:hypothetical protein
LAAVTRRLVSSGLLISCTLFSARFADLRLIDPVVKTVVSNNVRHLRNFYLSSGMGTAVERDGHFHGMLQNVDMGKTSYGHVALTTAPAIQNQIMRDVLSANAACR